METGLHFEAFYVSWISLRKGYFMRIVGQDLRQKDDFAAIINVKGHSWLKMIKGKHVLRTVIDKCFRVPDRTGKYLQGNERCMEVVKSLLKLPLEDQPSDFN